MTTAEQWIDTAQAYLEENPPPEDLGLKEAFVWHQPGDTNVSLAWKKVIGGRQYGYVKEIIPEEMEHDISDTMFCFWELARTQIAECGKQPVAG